jgi:hypothetical protein
MAVEKVGEGQTHWPAGHVARPTDRHLVSYRLSQVGGAPHGPINTPYRLKSTHTPHFVDSTSKALFLSVVARRSLVGRVARF